MEAISQYVFEEKQESLPAESELIESWCSPVQDVKLSLPFPLQLKLLLKHTLHPGSVSNGSFPSCSLQPPVLLLSFQQGCQDLMVSLLVGVEEFMLKPGKLDYM